MTMALAKNEISKEFKMDLPVPLTESEKAKKGHKAGQLKKKIQETKAEAKAATTTHRDRIKEMEAERDGLLDDLEREAEIRKVKCVENKDFKRNEARTYRLDTDEEVEERRRTLGPEEHQVVDPILAGDQDVWKEDDGGVDASDERPRRGRGRPKKIS
jgi:hypothetical protein